MKRITILQDKIEATTEGFTGWTVTYINDMGYIMYPIYDSSFDECVRWVKDNA